MKYRRNMNRNINLLQLSSNKMKKDRFNITKNIQVKKKINKKRIDNTNYESLAACFCMFSVLFIVTSVYIFYRWLIFPKYLSHIQPQAFDSHYPNDLDPDVRDLRRMKPRFFFDSFVSICEDMEVDKNEMVYCINQLGQIVKLNTKNSSSESIAFIENGKNHGLRLSKNEKLLYIVNSQLGLCELDIKSRKVFSLVNHYQGQLLMSLNSVEINPQDSNIVFLTESSTLVPMDLFHVDILMNNPFGRVFQFNKKTKRLRLLAQKMYFPNGVAFHKYKGQSTILVSQTSRQRVSRIYLNGEKRGQIQIAVNKMDIYPGTIKTNKQEETFTIAGMGKRSYVMGQYERWIFSRLPKQFYSNFMQSSYFGGAILTFTATSKSRPHRLRYCLYNSYPNYKFASTFLVKKDKLYMSSFQDQGILILDKFTQKQKRQKTSEDNKRNKKPIRVTNSGDRFMKKSFF